MIILSGELQGFGASEIPYSVYIFSLSRSYQHTIKQKLILFLTYAWSGQHYTEWMSNDYI